MNDQKDTDAPINMAMLYYEGLHQIDMSTLQASKEQDIMSYYLCLVQKKIYCGWKFAKKELNELDKLLADVSIKIKGQNLIKSNQIQQANHLETFNNLSEIDAEIWRLRHKYHMTFPNITVSKGISSLAKKYKLPPENGKHP